MNICAADRLETARLIIAPMNPEALNNRILETGDAAYCEMRDGALQHPEQALWYVPWGFYLKETGALTGDACFKGECELPEIGYGIDEDYRGRGYATEGVRALLKWAFDRGVIAIEAEAAPENAASRRVLQKLGFRPTGERGEEGDRYRLEAI